MKLVYHGSTVPVLLLISVPSCRPVKANLANLQMLYSSSSRAYVSCSNASCMTGRKIRSYVGKSKGEAGGQRPMSEISRRQDAQCCANAVHHLPSVFEGRSRQHSARRYTRLSFQADCTLRARPAWSCGLHGRLCARAERTR